MTVNFYSFDEWYNAAMSENFAVESWGFGSKSAHDIDGAIIGEWLNKFDTSDNRARGWLVVENWVESE